MKRTFAGVLCVLLLLCACGQAKQEETSVTLPTTTDTPTTLPPEPISPDELAWAQAKFDEVYHNMPVEIVPFRHKTFPVQISRDMQPFEFQLTGFIGHFQYDGWEHSVRLIRTIDVREYDYVTGAEGPFQQSLDLSDVPASLYYLNNGETISGFLLADTNNDGFLDMQVNKFDLSMGNALNRYPTLFWLWDDQQKKFVENKQLEEMSDVGTVTVENERLLHNSSGRNAGTLSYYLWQNNTFILVEEQKVHYADVDGTPRDWLDMSCDVYWWTETRKLINGEMKLVSTSKEKIERGEEP